MKKQEIKRVVRITLIMSFCALLFFVIVLTVSKKLDNRFIPGNITNLTPGAANDNNMKDVAAWSLFVIDKYDNLTGVYIAELDCLNGKWRLSALPLDTRLNISVNLYKELIKENVATPQLCSLLELYKCFDKTVAVDYTEKAVNELLPFKPDYRLVMPEEVFLEIFRENPEKYAYSYFLRDGLEEKIRQSGSMQGFMKEILEQCTCSISLKKHLYYLETFEGLSNLDVSCRLIPGSRHNYGYEVKADLNDFYKR